MKREKGIAKCGLACCLCSENEHCPGCEADGCPGSAWCENRKCAVESGAGACYLCEKNCKKGILGKSKPYGFVTFIKKYGMDELLCCLERNEKNGVVYHREGVNGDYDEVSDIDSLISFIKTGKC